MDENYNNLTSIELARLVAEISRKARSPFTDAFTQCTCKHELYLLKCLIEDLYKDLPEFPNQEKEWEQQRLMELLKK